MENQVLDHFTHITIAEAAKRLGMKSQRYLNRLCARNKIEGAVKPGREWLIPSLWVDDRIRKRESRDL